MATTKDLISPVDFALNDLHDDQTTDSESRKSGTSFELDDHLVSTPHEKLLKGYDDDLEAQRSDIDLTDAEMQPQEQQQATPAEYSVPTSRKLIFLAFYFVFNLGVTLGNKAVLKNASFPWTLTFCHTAATAFGCSALLGAGHFQLTRLSMKDNLILVAFSTLFTINIAISNVSLSLVSVPFHQIMRSSGPIVTISIYRIVYGRTYSVETYTSLIPLFIGVAMATFGSYYFTPIGFALTLLGVLLASIKTVATNQLMTGSLKLSAVEVLFRMSPLAAVQCLLYAFASGELTSIRTFAEEGNFTWPLTVGIVGNASMAFALNIISFQTNKVAGALTISVCGNVKQCLTILLGIVLFSVRISWVNGIGMLIAVTGAAIYSKVELDRKRVATEVKGPT